ncbi:MAG TPA: magnesium transporter [Polyangiales bacterium]|nr:magnesium transporter [Polyangiales bacterium]
MTSPAAELVQRFLFLHPGEAARQMSAAAPEDVARVLSGQPTDAAARILGYMQPDHAAEVLEAAGTAGIQHLLTALDPARAANLLARLEEKTKRDLLGALSKSLAEEIESILEFPPGTAGYLMDAKVTAFPRDALVSEALERVRQFRGRRISDLVITDQEGQFEGIVRLQDIVGAPPNQQLAELESPRAIFAHPMTPREEVVELLNEHHLSSLPVVDLQGHVVGIIRQAGLVEAAQEDAITDLQQMVGGSKEERALSRPLVGVRSRLPWLNINLLTAFLAASVVGLFENTIARFTAVAVLLPVVAGQSGNTGAQALAVTMRGLALREFRVSQAIRVLRKELVIGLVNGLAISLVTSFGVYLWSRNHGLAFVMFLAMLLSMIAASAAGALIPVALVKLNRDPATASSIILTTVTDVVGFFTFLGLATWLANLLVTT